MFSLKRCDLIRVIFCSGLTLLFTLAGSACQSTSNGTSGPCMQIFVHLDKQPSSADQAIHVQAGATIMTSWQIRGVRITGPNVQPTPLKQMVMQEQLFGPFPSLTAINHLNTLAQDPARHPLVLTSSLLTTNQCTAKTYQSSLTLPVHLKSGYYDLYQRATYTFTDGTTGSLTSDNPLVVGK